MTVTIDKDNAIEVVKQLYQSASDPMLDIELELTKGDKNYRPYIVAAKFMMAEYQRIIKADEVTFSYNIDAIRQLLNQQKNIDESTGEVIPDSQTADKYLAELCNTCGEAGGSSSNELGVYLI